MQAKGRTAAVLPEGGKQLREPDALNASRTVDVSKAGNFATDPG